MLCRPLASEHSASQKISIRSLGIEQQSIVQFRLPLLKPTLHEQGRSQLRVKQWQPRLLRCSFPESGLGAFEVSTFQRHDAEQQITRGESAGQPQSLVARLRSERILAHNKMT